MSEYSDKAEQHAESAGGYMTAAKQGCGTTGAIRVAQVDATLALVEASLSVADRIAELNELVKVR